MGRFDIDTDATETSWAMWQHNVALTVRGQRMRPRLEALEAALHALPEPVLIEGTLSDGEHVCALGALAAYDDAQTLGMPIERAIAGLMPVDDAESWEDGWDAWDSVALGEQHGLNRTLAWAIGQMNDEDLEGVTPGERWRIVVAWLAYVLRGEVPADPTVRLFVQFCPGVRRGELSAAKGATA